MRHAEGTAGTLEHQTSARDDEHAEVTGQNVIGRPERASPGEGYPAAHVEEQSRIIDTALDHSIPVSQYPKRLPGDR